MGAGDYTSATGAVLAHHWNSGFFYTRLHRQDRVLVEDPRYRSRAEGGSCSASAHKSPGGRHCRGIYALVFSAGAVWGRLYAIPRRLLHGDYRHILHLLSDVCAFGGVHGHGHRQRRLRHLFFGLTATDIHRHCHQCSVGLCGHDVHPVDQLPQFRAHDCFAAAHGSAEQ
ncbi:hypothetical protein D3C87_1150610 [compost metagenome]